MKKGLIFSIDSIYAIVFVVALAAAFSFYYTASATNSGFLEALNQQTTDTALVAFYLKKDASGFGGFEGSFVDADYSKCATLYDYTPDSTTLQATITPKKFCRGIR